MEILVMIFISNEKKRSRKIQKQIFYGYAF